MSEAVEEQHVLADGAGASNATETGTLNAPPKCWGCHKPIDGGSAIQFADGVWHIDCFQCTTCAKVIEFDSNLLFLADGKPICPECSYCCSLCKKPIFDEAIVTVEGTYHSECFRCTNCKQRIQGKSFAKTSQGIIYCVACYAERRERKKAAKRRREHHIIEEKMLPSLPTEAQAEPQAEPQAESQAESQAELRARRRGMHTSAEFAESASTDSQPAAASAPASPRAAKEEAVPVDALADGLDAGLAWTEDIDALEENFVRFSMRTPLKHATPQPSPTGQHTPESQPLARTTSMRQQPRQQQRVRATSTASALGSMVPPGLRSSHQVVSEQGGKEWLGTATVEQLKEELLVNYGQLCRMEASYQKLRDLYASVIDQVLEARDALHQERAKRLEYESILRNYYGYVDGADSQPKPQARSRPQPAPQPAPPRQSARAPVSRQPSLRRQRQARKETEHDSGSDDDAIITTMPQKATKRFIWPFGSSHGPAAGPASSEDHGPLQHSFHLASTFRAGKCDHCQERFKTFTNSVVRCRHCGFVCHQKCVGEVTASCSPGGGSGGGSIGGGVQPAKGTDALYDPNVPFQVHRMFGRDLVEQAAAEGRSVPWVVQAAVAFIEAEGIDMEGVYRRSGSTMDIREVQLQIGRAAEQGLDLAQPIADRTMDVASVTSVLKQYFRDLPNPLMTAATYSLWVQAANVPAEDERVRVYRTIADSMPTAHSQTLRFLMTHLKRIADHQHANKMTTNNLSVVFAPNILHMGKGDMFQEMANMSNINKTVSFVIQHATEIWGDAAEPEDEAAAEGEQGDGQLSVPPLRRQRDLGSAGDAALSSPSSPTRADAGQGDADGLSQSMPSPTGLFFEQQQHQHQHQQPNKAANGLIYSQQRTGVASSSVLAKSSFDIPRSK
ncbi:Rho-type gtpase-activating protein [Coemansia spiralis]|uniref:Rho-type gtpase-activating protein n=1 Tax=Coemansia spiralis TaxID=417178 RepID=A0A9W8KVI0_9FUNG|nr:Rho-type gtpase-activating protein [Coemansia spiralis]